MDDSGIRDLLRAGQQAEAIRVYQQFTGIDQFTAREAVRQIEREMRLSDGEAEPTDWTDDTKSLANQRKQG